MSLSPRDQAKWDRLQDSGGGAIDNILAGKGTEQDIKRISEALKEQHDVAGQLFDQRVQEAELTADAIVDRLNKERIDSGKKALTQKAHSRVFQATFQQVMSQAIEDILQMVHDDLEEQSDKVRDSVAEAMNKLRRSVVAHVEQATPEGEIPQPDRPPENESLLSRFTRQRGRAPESVERSRSRSLLDRVLGRNKQDETQRTSMLQIIKDSVSSAKDKISSLYTRLRGSKDGDEDKKASIWIRKLKAVFDPARNALKKAKRVGSKIGDIMGMIGKPLLLALLNPQLIKGITDSVSHYLNFDNISKYMSDMWESTKKFGSESIDWVIEKVKDFFGLGKKKEVEIKKPKPTEVAKPAGNTLPTELPKSVSARQASTELPKMQQGLEQATKTFAAAQDRYKANPNAANKKALDEARMNLTYWQNRVAIYQKRSNESKPAGSDVAQATTLVSPPKPAEGQSAVLGPQGQSKPAGGADVELAKTTATTMAAAPSAVMAASSVAMPKTTVTADTPQFTPGKAFDPPEKAEEYTTTGGTSPAAKAQIGIGSFGFDSNDSALNILNLGMLA